MLRWTSDAWPTSVTGTGLPSSRSSAPKPTEPPGQTATSTFSTRSAPGAGWAGRSSNSQTSSATCSAARSTWCRCAPCTRCCSPQSWPKPGPSMQRDILLLTEMIDAAEQARRLTADITVSQLKTDRQRRDALLWNFTVLGEAAGQLSDQLKDQFPEIAWQQPMRLRNRIVHGYWSIDLEVLHTTATEQLPAFVAGLRSVLSTLTDSA